MTIRRHLALILTALGLAVLIVSWSWVYTPHGRLDYSAALLSRMAAWQNWREGFGEETRQAANTFGRWLYRGFDTGGVSTADIEIPAPHGSIPARVYTPREGDGPFPAMLHYHGGGFWMGNGYVFDGPVMELAAKTGMVVVSIQYRLSPEHRFPAALDDSYRALEWVHDNAELFAIDTTRLGVMGASAGGNLAAAVALKSRDRGGPQLMVQSLLAPAVDLSDEQHWPSFDEMGDDYVLQVSQLPVLRRQYVTDSAQRRSPYASPLLAEDHSELPAAVITANQFDPLRDQAIAYARALEAAGCPSPWPWCRGYCTPSWAHGARTGNISTSRQRSCGKNSASTTGASKPHALADEIGTRHIQYR
jgi:acetyl esterase